MVDRDEKRLHRRRVSGGDDDEDAQPIGDDRQAAHQAQPRYAPQQGVSRQLAIERGHREPNDQEMKAAASVGDLEGAGRQVHEIAIHISRQPRQPDQRMGCLDTQMLQYADQVAPERQRKIEKAERKQENPCNAPPEDRQQRGEYERRQHDQVKILHARAPGNQPESAQRQYGQQCQGLRTQGCCFHLPAVSKDQPQRCQKDQIPVGIGSVLRIAPQAGEGRGARPINQAGGKQRPGDGGQTAGRQQRDPTLGSTRACRHESTGSVAPHRSGSCVGHLSGECERKIKSS